MPHEPSSRKQAAAAGRVEGPDLREYPIDVVRNSASTFVGQEVCLFVTYVPEGRLLPGALALVKALAASGLSVVVCCAVNDPGLSIDLAGLERAAVIVKRKNGGYDFAVWAAVLAQMPELWHAQRLFFANDSILGPLDGFDRTLERIRASEADFLALTESFEIRYHSQSYFFVLQNKGMSSADMRGFWRDVRVEKTKMAVIEKYEVGLLRFARDVAGLATEVLFSFDLLFPGAESSTPKRGNPTHHLWEHLIDSGFPFVKAELLYANPLGLDIKHWAQVVALHGGDVDLFEDHVAKMKETRGPPPSRRRVEGWKLLRWMIGDARLFQIFEIWSMSRRPRR